MQTLDIAVSTRVIENVSALQGRVLRFFEGERVLEIGMVLDVLVETQPFGDDVDLVREVVAFVFLTNFFQVPMHDDAGIAFEGMFPNQFGPDKVLENVSVGRFDKLERKGFGWIRSDGIGGLRGGGRRTNIKVPEVEENQQVKHNLRKHLVTQGMDGPLFTEEQCETWQRESRVQRCCKNPEWIKYLKQDRAIDEMPNVYRQCKNCQRIIKRPKL